MEVHITEQLTACAVFAALGVVSGCVYDILRAFRFFFLPGGSCARGRLASVATAAVDFILDIVFMLALAVACAILSFCFSLGKLRAFDAVSLCAAFFIYRRTLGGAVRFLLSTLSRLMRSAVRAMCAALLLPIKMSAVLAGRAGSFLFRQSVGKILRRRQLVRQRRYYNSALESLKGDVAF